MKRTVFRMREACWTLTLLFSLVFSIPSWAAFGEDTEKPKPEFTREGDAISAKLIPRGKGSSISIQFQTTGGKLLGIEGVDFDTAGQSGIDVKDFRSALFAVHIGGLQPGGEVQLSASSNYFTQATELWVLNRTLPIPWVNAMGKAIDRSNRVEELTLSIKDGGPLDSDGVANGEITLIVAPKDSFWGYAFGTLLIRFFGIFLVLGVLMVAMIAAGFVFQLIERKKSPERAPAQQMPVVGQEGVPNTVSPEIAAVIGLALELHTSVPGSAGIKLEPPDGSPWVTQGRNHLMQDGVLVQARSVRK